MAEENDETGEPDAPANRPANFVSPEEIARAHGIPAVWSNRAVTTRYGGLLRLSFAEGFAGPDTTTYRSAVMMTVEDAIGLAESIFRSAGARVERVMAEAPGEADASK